MALHLLTISERNEDIAFGKKLADANNFIFHHAVTRDEVRNLVIDHPMLIAFWDADHKYSASSIHPQSAAAIGEILMAHVPLRKVFAITSGPINQNPHLFDIPAFGHHIYRRFDEPAPTIMARVASAVLQPHPFDLSRYLPNDANLQKITLKESAHKKAAVEAVQNVLTKRGVRGRISALVAQATDELLMNAIWDAPTDPNGNPSRKEIPRTENFVLHPNEYVDMQVGESEKYIAICVADQFGSLKKEVVLSFLQKDYQKEAYRIRKTEGAGLGLVGIAQSGLSSLFISKPNTRTEVMLFVPKTSSFKDFKTSFRFVSLISSV